MQLAAAAGADVIHLAISSAPPAADPPMDLELGADARAQAITRANLTDHGIDCPGLRGASSAAGHHAIPYGRGSCAHHRIRGWCVGDTASA